MIYSPLIVQPSLVMTEKTANTDAAIPREKEGFKVLDDRSAVYEHGFVHQLRPGT